MIALDFSGLHLRLKQDAEKTLVFDPVRKRWIILTPEEHVRQYLLQYLIHGMEYPSSLIAVEKKIISGKVAGRFDVAVYDRLHNPWLLAECKEPEAVISETTLFQLLNYHRSIPCKYWLLTNGHQTFCADANNVNDIKWLENLPSYQH
ncbi:MAG TPA: type I restriction enzyme HsdR N-terminal domain-containing protein [Flavipsychrobacter sp.]|nr:type I restriction enzyme HsdR N-terminal domain-containing protein [Flavipsychrobacter sp.]